MSANRFRLVFLVIAPMLLALPAAGPALGADFTVVTSNPTPVPGDVFTVTVNTTALPANITGLKVRLDFNTPQSILEFEGTDPAGSTPGCGGVSYPAGSVATLVTGGNFASWVATSPSITAPYIAGSGCVVVFKFRVETTIPVPGPGDRSDLSLSAECELIDNTGTPVPVGRGPAASAIVPYPVSGNVLLWKCSRTIADRGIGDVSLTLDQPTVPHNKSDVSDVTTGAYSIPGITNHGATLASARHDLETDFNLAATTDVKAAITATDMAMVAQHYAAPSIFPLDECPLDAGHSGPGFPQRYAANVDGNAAINSNDGTVILQIVNYGLGVGAFPATYPIAANWVFKTQLKDLGVLTPPAANYDPLGILLGDVNGSYRDTALPRKTMPQTVLVIPEVRTSAARVTVPVQMRSAHGVLGVQARVIYNPSVLRYVGADTQLDASRQAWVEAGDGVLALVAIGVPQAIDGDATLAQLHFERVDPTAARAISPLLLGAALADDQDVRVENGVFTTPAVAVQNAPWASVKSLYR